MEHGLTGKPLYQKTLSKNIPTNSVGSTQTASFYINDLSADDIWVVVSDSYIKLSSSSGRTYPVSYYGYAIPNSTTETFINTFINNLGNYIQLRYGIVVDSGSTAILTIRYTKKTD